MNYCNHNSYDRFQGAWLGSIIGTAFGISSIAQKHENAVAYQFQDLIKVREKIAQTIIQAQRVEIDLIAAQLTSLTPKFTDIQGNSVFIPINSYVLSALLPLVIFEENNQDIYQKLVSKCNLLSDNESEIKEDILLWTYLLTLTLDNRFKLEDTNVSMIVKQVLGGVEVKTASSIAKLNILSKAEKCGSSLTQLAEKIYQIDDINNSNKDVMLSATSAICLSLYCFATTPNNFMLSVQRASYLPDRLSQFVTTLTATLSGAYNGISSIPRNWQRVGKKPNAIATQLYQDFQQAKTTVRYLHQTWLGTYHSNSLDLLYDPTLHAVAPPQTIQSRLNLKIISQKP